MKDKLPFILIVVVLVAYVYAPLTQIGFAKVDDKWMLLDEQFSIFDWAFLRNVFSETNSLQYAPINTLYYYVVYQVNGFDPYYFHLFSLLVHLLNVGLTYILVKKLLDIFLVLNAVVVSFATALVWAILPFNVESVVWISASKILLYTFWGNVSFVCFIDAYLKSSKWLYISSLVAFVLSFLAKEQAVLYPLMMALFVYVYQLKFYSKSNIKKLVLYTGPVLLLAFVFGLITAYIAIYGEGFHHVDRYPFSQRIILAFYCLYFYIFSCFVPINLHYHYPFPMKIGSALPIVYYIFPCLTIIIGWFSYNMIKNNTNKLFYIMCLGIFIINLLLTIQIVPLARASMLADRYMYISSIGLLLIALTVLNEKFDLTFKKATTANITIAICFALYVLALSFYSHNLVNHWQTMQL